MQTPNSDSGGAEVVELEDLSSHGYKVERELGCNHGGGRVTYLATEIESGNQVVIFNLGESGRTS